MKPLLLLLAFVLLSGCSSQSYQIKKWEYKVVKNDPATLNLESNSTGERFVELGQKLQEQGVVILNENGLHGWELAEIVIDNNYGQLFVFKRPLVE